MAFHCRPDLPQGMLVVSDRVRHDAVGGCVHLQVSHVRVVGRKQDADVAGDACQKDAAGSEAAEQRVQGRVKEPGVLGLQDKIVARVGRRRWDTSRPGEVRAVQCATVWRKSERHCPKLSFT